MSNDEMFIDYENTPVEPTTVSEEIKAFNAELRQSIDIGEVNGIKYSYAFPLPSVDLETLKDKLVEFKNVIDETNPGHITWKNTVEESADLYTQASLYQKRFVDKDSKFLQGIESNNDLKSISNLKFRQSEGELKGELAVLKVAKLLGLGDVLTIPLPHSGIWVTIKPPTEKDLIDFYNSIFKEKIALGRATFGLTLTNFSVYINNKLFDFIIKHIHSINYSDIPKTDIKDYVLINDFYMLAWGFAATLYPNGFEYSRACVNDVEKCTYIANATLNMHKLLWIDNSVLTPVQTNILYENRPNKLTIDSYNKYKTEHTRVISSEFTVKDSIKFKLKIPTFTEYTNDGMTWINKINSAVDSLLVTDTDEDEDKKKALLDQYVRSSILRQYSHFIDYIEVDENTIADRDTINQVLETLSADDEYREEIAKNILKYKEDTTIAIIGIPEYKCPSCNKEQNDLINLPRFTNVIPLDVMQLFFSLITLRITKILEREV